MQRAAPEQKSALRGQRLRELFERSVAPGAVVRNGVLFLGLAGLAASAQVRRLGPRGVPEANSQDLVRHLVVGVHRAEDEAELLWARVLRLGGIDAGFTAS